jgi:hypothetical protein
MDKGRAIISALQGAIDLNASTVAAPRGQGKNARRGNATLVLIVAL